MITRSDVLQAQKNTYVHYGICEKVIGPRGGIKLKTERYRIVSEVQTWKTRPEEFAVSLRFGVQKRTDILTDKEVHQFYWEKDCTVEKGNLRVTRLL